jgi:hypothetical protein
MSEKLTPDANWRVSAMINRLISNIPAACKVLREQGHASLAFQLCQDQSSLVYWQEHSGLTPIVPAKESEVEGDESDE